VRRRSESKEKCVKKIDKKRKRNRKININIESFPT
jgi:hypothetical protein